MTLLPLPCHSGLPRPAAASVALIGGPALAAQRQPGGFDSTVQTVSALSVGSFMW